MCHSDYSGSEFHIALQEGNIVDKVLVDFQYVQWKVFKISLSSAPYGYRYLRKTDKTAAYYEIIEAKAEAVLNVFKLYTKEKKALA